MNTSTPDIIFPGFNISINQLDRVAFSIFGFDIYWYGLLICIGALIGIAFAAKYAKSIGINSDFVIDYAVFVILFGIIGARLYYLIFHGDSLTQFFAIRDGGLAIYGGIIAGAIFTIFYTRKKQVPFLKFGDVAVQGVIIGQIIGRYGNFVNREAFGGPATGFSRLLYKANQISGLVIKDNIGIYNSSYYPLEQINSIAYISVHPTFLYESVWNLLTLIFIICFRKHKKFDGQIACIYFIFYGAGRFLIESIRTDQLMLIGIPVSMLLSALLVIFWLIFMIYKLKQAKEVI